MKKRLITVKNLSEFVQNKELVVQADMIITPGAKDRIKKQKKKWNKKRLWGFRKKSYWNTCKRL